MGPLLVLACPCLQRNVVVTCKIVSFFCVVEIIFFRKMWLFSFLQIKFLDGAHLKKKKGLFLTYFPNFLVTREKSNQIPSSHISLTYIYTYFAYPFSYWLLCLTNFAKITNLWCMVSLWCDSWCWFLFAPFCRKQWIMTKWWAKFKLECQLLIFFYCKIYSHL